MYVYLLEKSTRLLLFVLISFITFGFHYHYQSTYNRQKPCFNLCKKTFSFKIYLIHCLSMSVPHRLTNYIRFFHGYIFHPVELEDR